MTKTTLIKWLEGKKSKAVDVAEKKYNQERSLLLDAACADLGLTDTAEKIESLLKEARAVWDEWKAEHESIRSICKITDNYWSSFTMQIHEYMFEKGAALKAILSNMVTLDTKEMEILRKEYTELLDNISRTYTTVIEVVKASKNAKEAAAYLTDLGFDISEIETDKAPVTALTVPINTAYLFIGKEAA